MIWNIKRTKISIAINWDIAPIRYRVFDFKYFCNIPIGISIRKETKFQSQRNTHTKTTLSNLKVKKKTTVKWKSIHKNPWRKIVIKKFLFLFPLKFLSTDITRGELFSCIKKLKTIIINIFQYYNSINYCF